MATSRDDRIALARHNYPQSPFNRARERNYEFNMEPTLPTSPKQNGTRNRHTYRTGTLAGAYRAASRASLEEGIQLGSSPSPRQARRPFAAFSPKSEASNTHLELYDTYQRNEEDGIPGSHALFEGLGGSRRARSGSRTSRTSSHTRDHDHGEVVNHGLAISETSLFSENERFSPRRKTSDYTKDEQRLRRVTGKDSPVFSRAKVGARAALTADNLQRREDEVDEVESQHVSEDDNENGPSLNLPTTWGSRATRRQEWLRNVSQRSVSDQSKEREEEQPNPRTSEIRPETNARPKNTSVPKFRTSPRALERSRDPTRNVLEERTVNPPVQQAPAFTFTSGQKNVDSRQNSPEDGDPIPNTPIVVFKGSNYIKPNLPKRDSQDLLRRLSRTESPKLEQVQTPEPPKLFERRIYDKTPRVTGAWIDTPMTEKVTQLPADLTKDIVSPPVVSPPVVPSKVDAPVQQIKPPVQTQSKPESQKNEPFSTKEAPIEESQPSKSSKHTVVRPKLPKSGLETVIEDMNSGKESFDVSDDTIESLQAIMDDQSALKTEEEEEAAYEKEVIDKLKLAETNGQKSYDTNRLDDKLTSLKTHIEQVKKGLNRLENHVARQDSILSQPSASATKEKETQEKPQATHSHTIIETCKHCESNSDGRVYAAIPLPRLWKQNLSTGRRQLTKLGWFTLISLTWYVVECTMMELYSHPLISDTCEGYCLLPDAPEFPWVTTTMLWRWSRLSTVLLPVFTIIMALLRLFAQLLGLWDGYVDEPGQLGSLIGEIRINGTPVSFPWLSSPTGEGIPPPQEPAWTPRSEPPPRVEMPVTWGDDLPSMDEDEYL
ncbi:hypothetical protein N7488_000657 [Penicillium malachiteum]|nr:hypothetical protein N7488_000657 [Penicillium malachiteum]